MFVNVADPVGAGFVESLARPGGNVTGFIQFEYSLSGKWVELLKQIAPGMTRAAVLRDPTVSSGIGQFAVVQSVAPAAGMEVVPIDVREAAEVERRLAAFASAPNGGVIATASARVVVHRDLVVALAARHRLPVIYHRRAFVQIGGLISYGPKSSPSSPRRAAMPAASSTARSRPTCRCRLRPSMSLRSIFEPRRRSA